MSELWQVSLAPLSLGLSTACLNSGFIIKLSELLRPPLDFSFLPLLGSQAAQYGRPPWLSGYKGVCSYLSS